MRIGIDVRMWSESGIGRYIRNLVKQLVLMDSSHQFVLFGLSKDWNEISDVVGGANVRFVESNFGWYSFAEQIKLPILLYREDLDLVHFPHFNIPVLYFKPFVVTIHDLIHFSFDMHRVSTLPVVVYRLKKIAYRLAFSQAVKRSKHLITVSHYVKDQIVENFGVDAEKISVTYEAGDGLVVPAISSIDPEPKPYFFYVGNAHPHKNIEFLLQAFSVFRKQHPEYSLVLAGKRNYFWEQTELYAAEHNLSENVVFKGYVDDNKLGQLYSNATAFVFPSLSEGFGLPLLEAMLHKCPVISSSATCLPEIAGEAALYFDPKDVKSLVEAMEHLVNDMEFRNGLISKGTVQAARYSWKSMASLTLEIYSR
jgi:glycosyltransferase involved in cell wall biosynthesis